MKNLVTDIQRFSLNDGDGIRTTVFLKGCNMHCPWCHNPETISRDAEIMLYESRCIGCGRCFEVCPKGAHKIVDTRHIIDRELCVNCGACAEVCYAEALIVSGREMTVDEIVGEIIQDKPYYDNSGGGVTISGGEVLCSLDFAIEIMKACKSEGINVAVETNLSFPKDYISRLEGLVDAVMFDIKIADDVAHREHTGVSNALVFENARLLDSFGIPLTVRTPLIPGVTDNEENIGRIAEFVSTLKNLYRYEMLNFNPLGEGKYKALMRPNAYESARPLPEERLEELRSLAESYGIRVKIS